MDSPAKRAANTLKKLYGDDYFSKIGSRGGKNNKTGGFASDVVGKDGLTGKQRAVEMGKKTRRGKSNDAKA